MVRNVLCSNLIFLFLSPVSRGYVRLCQKRNADAAAGCASSFSTLPLVLALEFQVVRKVFDLRLEKSHGQCSFLVSKRKSWLHMTSSARIPILDPALLIIVRKKGHFGRVSNVLRKVPSVELWNHHEVLPPSHFQQGSLVLEKLPDGLYLSFIPESTHFQTWTRSSMNVFCEICTFSNCEEKYITQQFWLDWNTTRVSLNGTEESILDFEVFDYLLFLRQPNKPREEQSM